MELTSSAPLQTTDNAPALRPRLAHFLLWLTATILIVGAWLGALFDGWWHITEPFDEFFSPPHVFIYSMSTIAGLLVMGMVFTPSIRRVFGTGFNVFVVPFKLPGSLFILSASMVMLGFAGLILDNFWHSTFGLNETNWSFPHAMLGTSLWLASLGFVACRLALARYKPLRWYSVMMMAVIGLWGTGAWLGPLASNQTPETVRATANIPVLAQQAPFQNTIRIYETWNLNRTHPALMVLGAVTFGMGLSFLRGFEKRWWLILLAVLLWQGSTDVSQDSVQWLSQFGEVSDTPANRLGLPFWLPSALFLLLIAVKVPERWAYAAGGVLFALMTFGIWGTEGSPAFWLIIPAAPAAMLGAWIGRWIYQRISQPTDGAQTLRLILLLGVAVPFVTGVIDLVLRAATL